MPALLSDSDSWPIGLLALMKSFTELTDALILLIPEGGSRISNDQIKNCWSNKQGPISDQMLKKIKERVVQVGAAEAARFWRRPQSRREHPSSGKTQT